MHPAIEPSSLCAVVLAGGKATRMGGVDKGLQLFQGVALAWHAVQRLKAQTLGCPRLVAINANRNVQEYTSWGTPVWPDTLDGFAGPLAGFQTAMAYARQTDPPCEYLLLVPCDSPLFPLDLLERLANGLVHANAEMAVAAIPEPDAQGTPKLRMQPVFCLVKTELQASLNHYLEQGGRKVEAWAALNRTVTVPFDAPGDDPRNFFNTNTLDQLHQLERT